MAFLKNKYLVSILVLFIAIASCTEDGSELNNSSQDFLTYIGFDTNKYKNYLELRFHSKSDSFDICLPDIHNFDTLKCLLQL